MQGVLPDPISSHFVVVEGRRFPPKQVIGRVTGLDRADFTTHQARRILMRLGFSVGRRPVQTDVDLHADRVQPATAPDVADSLRTLSGQWVAVGNDEVLVAADTPAEVIGWLSQHDVQAESMFRVPEDELAVTGLAPL